MDKYQEYGEEWMNSLKTWSKRDLIELAASIGLDKLSIQSKATEFEKSVSEMRVWQKKFFASGIDTPQRTEALKKSKELEARIDQILSNQPTLFQ